MALVAAWRLEELWQAVHKADGKGLAHQEGTQAVPFPLDPQLLESEAGRAMQGGQYGLALALSRAVLACPRGRAKGEEHKVKRAQAATRRAAARQGLTECRAACVARHAPPLLGRVRMPGQEKDASFEGWASQRRAFLTSLSDCVGENPENVTWRDQFTEVASQAMEINDGARSPHFDTLTVEQGREYLQQIVRQNASYSAKIMSGLGHPSTIGPGAPGGDSLAEAGNKADEVDEACRRAQKERELDGEAVQTVLCLGTHYSVIGRALAQRRQQLAPTLHAMGAALHRFLTRQAGHVVPPLYLSSRGACMEEDLLGYTEDQPGKEELALMNRVPCNRILGMLIWLMTCTRPDVALAVNLLSNLLIKEDRPGRES